MGLQFLRRYGESIKQNKIERDSMSRVVQTGSAL